VTTTTNEGDGDCMFNGAVSSDNEILQGKEEKYAEWGNPAKMENKKSKQKKAAVMSRWIATRF